MTRPTGDLERECVVFTRYLTGLPASEYVRGRYAAAHHVHPRLADATTREAQLIALARRGPRWSRLADAYAVLLAPRSLLRRKLVVLLAVLETCPPYFEVFDRAARGGWMGAVLSLTVRGLWAVVVSAAALIIVPALRFLQGRREI